jgi:hypothetical protein
MKRFAIVSLLALLIFGITPAFSTAAESPSAILRHVVSFKFKSSATAADIQRIQDEFVALKKKISEIRDLEFGKNISPEKLDRGHTHCFIVSFASEKDRDAYLVHPAHEAFVKILKPLLDEPFVVDFWAHR